MPGRTSHYADLVKDAIPLYLQNKRLEAYDLLDDKKYVEAHGGKVENEPDASSLLKATNAMINLVEGLLSGSSENLSKCIDDFWAAEKLSNYSKDKEWIGNRISRGLSYMFGGLLQVFVGSYVKAGMNLTVGFKLIRDVEEDVLSYEGADKELIRSMGLLVLGLLNFFAIFLPPSITTIGDYLGLGLSKEKFSTFMGSCNTEGGVFSYISRLILVYYMVNSKNFMLDRTSPEDVAECRALLDSCIKDAPDSVIVRVMNASVCLAEGKPDAAVATLSDAKIREVNERPEWATMALATEYKLGVAYLCCMDFVNAGAAFGRAALCVERIDSWNYIPFMKSLEVQSLFASVSVGAVEMGDITEFRKKALSMVRPAIVNRDTAKTIVLPGDLWGARTAWDYGCMSRDFSDKRLVEYIKSQSPVVDLLFALLTCLYQFDKVEHSRLKNFVTENQSLLDMSRMRTHVMLGEFYRKSGKYNKAVNCFDDAIAMADRLREDGKKDTDAILCFSLVFQGAALCVDGETETAKEVLADLDAAIEDLKSQRKVGIVQSFSGVPVVGSPGDNLEIVAGNLVNPNGGELDLLLSFRRSSLKRKIDGI